MNQNQTESGANVLTILLALARLFFKYPHILMAVPAAWKLWVTVKNHLDLKKLTDALDKAEETGSAIDFENYWSGKK